MSGRRLDCGIALAVLVLLLAAASRPPVHRRAQCKGGDAAPAKLSGKRAAKAVLCLLNKERRSHGLKPLDRQNVADQGGTRAQPEDGQIALLLPSMPR